MQIIRAGRFINLAAIRHELTPPVIPLFSQIWCCCILPEKICTKQAFWLVKVVLCRCVMDRYCVKLIVVVKVIAFIIECTVINIRCDDGIERHIV